MLLEDAARRVFDVSLDRRLIVTPAPNLTKAEVREVLTAAARAGEGAVVYLQDKLGGEISVSPTDRSPELAFDITMVEIVDRMGVLALGRYAIFEAQTMDFHGSYRSAVQNLKDALRLHGTSFPNVLQDNQRWLSEHIEGPNIANVFKRTFYQIMLKFHIATHASCAGCVLALPASVWDSWQRHLGRPELMEQRDGTFALWGGSGSLPAKFPAWIYVFDRDSTSQSSPNPIQLRRVIGTNAEAVSHYALRVAPDAAVATGGAVDRLMVTIRRRVAVWWPDVAAQVVAPN